MLTGSMFGQQIPHFSQYDLNHYAINPAATGVTEDIPIAFSFRKLWAGVPGSPSVQYLSGDMKLADAMGGGAKVFAYQAGHIHKTGLELTYSYHFNINKSSRIALGLSGLFYQYNLDKSNFKLEEDDDKILYIDGKKIVQDASFGAYYYAEKFYVGAAIPQLFNKNINFKKDDDVILQESQVRHYYVHSGLSYDLNIDFTMHPSVMFRFVEAGLYQLDINAKIEYVNTFSLGVSFRTSDAIVVGLGYKNDGLTIGYAIDFTFIDLKASTFASHEVFISYKLENIFN